jgi:CTP synthase
VGGTVGDIESLPFLEALRQMRHDVGAENTLYVHVTYLPYIAASGELKTKPTQHSVRELRSIGIQPDVIVARADYPIEVAHIRKISQFCNVEMPAVIPAKTADVLYGVPLLLAEEGLDKLVVEKLKMPASTPNLTAWTELIEHIRQATDIIHIGIVGKYVELHDAYMSVREALFHAAGNHNRKAEIVWIHSGDLEKGKGWEQFEVLDGIVVPGGFGYRGIEGKIQAATWARENKVPYLGLCLGMQVMCIEFGRFIYNSDEPNSTEFDKTTEHPIISLMPDQNEIADMGGTMRLGAYPCQLTPESRAALAYEEPIVLERHRHRWEFNNAYREVFENAGMIFSGVSPDGRLVEISELKDHPFMLGSQFHPEFKSRPNRPHPLFDSFMAAAVQQQKKQTAKQSLNNHIEPEITA